MRTYCSGVSHTFPYLVKTSALLKDLDHVAWADLSFAIFFIWKGTPTPQLLSFSFSVRVYAWLGEVGIFVPRPPHEMCRSSKWEFLHWFSISFTQRNFGVRMNWKSDTPPSDKRYEQFVCLLQVRYEPHTQFDCTKMFVHFYVSSTVWAWTQVPWASLYLLLPHTVQLLVPLPPGSARVPPVSCGLFCPISVAQLKLPFCNCPLADSLM
jgi:hypothetical protein